MIGALQTIELNSALPDKGRTLAGKPKKQGPAGGAVIRGKITRTSFAALVPWDSPCFNEGGHSLIVPMCFHS